MRNRLLFLALCFVGLEMPRAFADRGVINDPDGFTNVRAEQTRESAIVAKAKNGEVIEFETVSGSDWWKVTLASGKQGYMHSSRIRLQATMADLADAPANDEIHVFARREGLDIYALARAAAKGDTAAMKRFFAFQSDGAAMETHDALYLAVIHLLGDQKLAQFLAQSTAGVCNDMRGRLENSSAMPFEAQPYLKRHFPKTAALLFSIR